MSRKAKTLCFLMMLLSALAAVIVVEMVSNLLVKTLILIGLFVLNTFGLLRIDKRFPKKDQTP